MPTTGRGFCAHARLSQSFGQAPAAAIFIEGWEELGVQVPPVGGVSTADCIPA